MSWHQTDQSAAPKVALGSPEPSERDQPVPVLKTVGETFQRDAAQPWTRRCTKRSPSSNTLHCIQPILDPSATHVSSHPANDELAEPVVSDRIDDCDNFSLVGTSRSAVGGVSEKEAQLRRLPHRRRDFRVWTLG